MRYAKIVIPIMLFLMVAPASQAAWFKKDSKVASKAKTNITSVAQKQRPSVVLQTQKQMPVVAMKPQQQRQVMAASAPAVENSGFVDLDLSSGEPRVVSDDREKEAAKTVRLEKDEFEKKKKEIETLMANVNSAKGVGNIPSGPAVQSLGVLPRKESYAAAKGNNGLTIELGALPKSTISGTATGNVAQKPSVPTGIVKR